MPVVDGVKYACSRCIRGHRVSRCEHVEEELFMIKPKGRPSTHCAHCKTNRKRGVHAKCVCNTPSLDSCKCGPVVKCVCGARRRRMPATLPPRALVSLEGAACFRTPEEEPEGLFYPVQVPGHNQGQGQMLMGQPQGSQQVPGMQGQMGQMGHPVHHMPGQISGQMSGQMSGAQGPGQQNHTAVQALCGLAQPPPNNYYLETPDLPSPAADFNGPPPRNSYQNVYGYSDYASGAYTGYASACYGYQGGEYPQMYMAAPNMRGAMAYPSPSYEQQQTQTHSRRDFPSYLDAQQIRSMSLGSIQQQEQIEHDRRHSEPAYRHEATSLGYTVPLRRLE